MVAALYDLVDDMAKERRTFPRALLSHKAIAELAETRPITLKELSEIKGIGLKKAVELGDRFIALFLKYRNIK